MDYAMHLITLVMVFSILAVSLDLVVGHGGVLSVCHAAFEATGAYVAALVALRLNLPYPAVVGAGMIAAALVSLAVAMPLARAVPSIFALGTVILQLVLISSIQNWTSATGGVFGVTDIPEPTLVGWHIDSSWEYALCFTLAASLVWIIARLIVTAPFGRLVRGIREQEELVASYGKPVFKIKVATFAISAAGAGLAGALYASYMAAIDPGAFSIGESVLILAMVVVGGAGTKFGPLLGALLVVLLPELLLTLGLSEVKAALLRQIVFGSLLVLVVAMRAQRLSNTDGGGVAA